MHGPVDILKALVQSNTYADCKRQNKHSKGHLMGWRFITWVSLFPQMGISNSEVLIGNHHLDLSLGFACQGSNSPSLWFPHIVILDDENSRVTLIGISEIRDWNFSLISIDLAQLKSLHNSYLSIKIIQNFNRTCQAMILKGISL